MLQNGCKNRAEKATENEEVVVVFVSEITSLAVRGSQRYFKC